MDELIIAKLMKQGRADEIKKYLLAKKSLEEGNESFVSFMDRMINQSGMKRAQIVQRAGLSKDYMYKVLRGDKTTTERDYLIAFCMAAKMDIVQTQHALELYPFQPLSDEDIRSHLIISAIMGETGIDTLNETLEKIGLPLLRTSPEMPSVKVGPARSTSFMKNLVSSISDEGDEPRSERRLIKMKKVNTNTSVEQVGMAPVDLAIGAEFELRDNKGKTVFAQAYFHPEFSFFAINKTSMYKEEYMEKGTKTEMEHYETLEDAYESKYFMFFVELDKLTDEKVNEALKQIDDTKYHKPCYRIGRNISGGKEMKYAEVYNNSQPERNEYLQIRITEEGTTYSVSHQSYYMQYEMGPIYDAYFPTPEKQLYLVEASSIDELGDYIGYRAAFEDLMKRMDAAFRPPEIQIIDSRIMSHEDKGSSKKNKLNTIIDAEVEVSDKGEKVFLHARWSSDASSEFIIEATKESLYELYEKLNNGIVDEKVLIEDINRIKESKFDEDFVAQRYAAQCDQLVRMVAYEMFAKNIDPESLLIGLG